MLLNVKAGASVCLPHSPFMLLGATCTGRTSSTMVDLRCERAHLVALVRVQAEHGAPNDLQGHEAELLLNVDCLPAGLGGLQQPGQALQGGRSEADHGGQDLYAQGGGHEQALPLPQVIVGGNQARAQDGQEGLVAEVQVLGEGLQLGLKYLLQALRAAGQALV